MDARVVHLDGSRAVSGCRALALVGLVRGERSVRYRLPGADRGGYESPVRL